MVLDETDGDTDVTDNVTQDHHKGHHNHHLMALENVVLPSVSANEQLRED